MYCSKCGASIQKESKFCANCGNKVNEVVNTEQNNVLEKDNYTNTQQGVDNQDPIINQNKKWTNLSNGKYFIIIGVIVIMAVIVLPQVFKLWDTYILNNYQFKKDEDYKFEEKANIAIKKVKEKYSNFTADPKEVYVGVNKYKDIWYAYAFPELDKGFGAEVYYNEGTYTVNFDYKLYENRVKLINKMNQLMPEIRNLNSYVQWNPYMNDQNYKTVTNRGDIALGYIVVKNNINIDNQLAIDYEILKYTFDLSKQLGVYLDSMRVGYYEGNNDNIKVTDDKGSWSYLDRSLNVSCFETYFEPSNNGINKVSEYWITAKNDNDRAVSKDSAVDLEQILKSKTDFIQYVKSIMKISNKK